MNSIINGWGKGTQIIKHDYTNCNGGVWLTCKPDKLLGEKHFSSEVKNGVASYEVINVSSNKDTKNTIKRTMIGSFLAGNAGAIAGAATSKTNNVYTIAVTFKDGKRSLIELDEEYYKIFIRDCFV